MTTSRKKGYESLLKNKCFALPQNNLVVIFVLSFPKVRTFHVKTAFKGCWNPEMDSKSKMTPPEGQTQFLPKKAANSKCKDISLTNLNLPLFCKELSLSTGKPLKRRELILPQYSAYLATWTSRAYELCRLLSASVSVDLKLLQAC